METRLREGHGFADVLPQDAGSIGPQKPPGGHFLGPFARERQAQVHIVEDGRQQEQQDDDGQQAQHLDIPRASEAVTVAGEEERFVHAVCLPSIYLLSAPGGIIVLVQEGFHLGLHVCKVGILPHPEPGVIADAVEHLSLFDRPAVRDIRDDVRRHEESAVEIGINALDGTVHFVHLDGLADLCIYLPSQGCADEDILLAHEVFQASLQEVILRENLEEVGIGLDSGRLDGLLPYLNDRLPQQRGTGRRLDLRNVHLQLLLVPIGQAQKLVASQHERPLPLRRLMRHLVLLYHIRANQDHKRETYRQPHRLDDGV